MKRCHRVFALTMAAAAWSQAANTQPKGDRYYNLEQEVSGKFVCTEATQDAKPVKLWGPILGGREDQYAFKLVASGEKDYFYLIHKLSGKYLCTEAGDNVPIHLWGPIPEGHQDRYKFKLFDAGDGCFYLLHKYSGKYVYSASKDNGTALAVYGPISENDQDRYKFRFTPAAAPAGSGVGPGK